MHFTTSALAAFALLSLASAAPLASKRDAEYTPTASAVTFPLANGFPNIQNPSDALTQIELQAHGTLPNGTPPPSLNPDDLTSLRLIAFNELFEVFFFTELLYNVTNSVPGYEIRNQRLKQQLISELTAVVAQEELHALNANGALAHFNADPIQPAQYKAGVSDLKSAISLASTFTDVVLGTLQDVIVKLGLNGDAAVSRGIASVVGQEGEQNGFYRSLLGKLPSALPFLTASTREFAFSALNQNFVIPGTAPNIDTIDLPIFGALNVLTPDIQPQDQNLQFSFATTADTTSADGLWLVYINQQNTPVVEAITDAQTQDGVVTFAAPFPFNENELNGLTIAAVTKGSGPFANVDDVANATVFGPGLIEVN
ncbi:hypothetical protein DV737_g1203, partial [Chaetothyriales sp. CBS 132003]